MPQMNLGDLIASEGRPRLTLVSGGAEALRRPVRGVHSTEMEHPTMWVERGWVVLTSGLGLRRRPDRQRRLIAELDDAGVTALGFGIGSAFSVVPPALADEARKRGFPVFVVPWDVSFRDMIRDVYEALVSDDIRGYQRLVSMQHYLLDALADEAPQDTVLARLSSLVRAQAAVIDPGGRLARATGELPARAIWERLSSEAPMVRELDIDGWHAVAVPLADEQPAAVRWLVVATQAEDFSTRLTKRLVQITAPLLSAMTRIDAVAQAQERQIKASLLAALVDGDHGQDERALTARALEFSVELGRDTRVIVAGERAGGSSADVEEVLEALERSIAGVGATALAGVNDGLATAIVDTGGSEGWPALRQTLATELDGVAIGAGRPVGSIAGVPRSHADALLALRSARERGEPSVVGYDELDLDAILVREVPPERWLPRAAAFVEPLVAHDQLRATVVAYFANDLDAVATAEALHLHPNSLRYRLRRIEELLGCSLRSPSTIAALQLALLGLGEDFGEPGGGTPRD